MAEVKKPKTKSYVLTGRDHRGFDEDGNTKLYVTGDKVPLTDSLYEAFKDKFRAPDEPVKEEAPKTPIVPGAPGAAGTTEA